jgi:hypothetical protein
VEIYALFFDEDHNIAKEINGEIDFSPFDDDILIPYFQANLRPGQYDCRIVARDKETGQALVGTTAFEIPDTSSDDKALTSPLLFTAGSESKVFKFSKRKKATDRELSLGDVYRFLPKNHRLIVREIGPETKNLLAVLPLTFASGSAPAFEFAALLRPKSEGETMEIPIKITDVRSINENKDILMMEISLPELAPGEYELEIEAFGKDTSARLSVHRSLILR